MGRPRILRLISLVVLTLFIAIFGFVQIQQRLLRHRAQRLHAEILALQLHPGTFADIQRLQHEWGGFAHYEGECTQHHCIYDIVLQDLVTSMQPVLRTEPSAPRWLIWMAVSSNTIFGNRYDVIVPWFMRIYRILGGRPTFAYANVRIRDNRMWGADFGLAIWAYPGTGRNDGQPYFVFAGVNFGSRLISNPRDISPGAIKQGFQTKQVLNCLGCESASVSITSQTRSDEIRRFNQFNFDCITRIKTCRHPSDLAPTLSETAAHDTASSAYSDDDDLAFCQLPTSVLAREANDILLVEVLSTKPYSPHSTAGMETIRVLKTLKNGHNNPIGATLDFSSFPMAVRTASGTTSSFVKGERYFFLYNHPKPNSIENWLTLRPCHALPDTPANAAEVENGIALDPSSGEPYDYMNEP